MSMSTSNATDQASQVSAPGPRSRLRGYLVRRGRQLGRALLILLIGLLFMAGLLEAWRGASMLGLPDVGDPFDVAEFQAFRIPPEQDAVGLFRRAQEKLTRMPNVSNAASRLGPNVGWSKVAPSSAIGWWRIVMCSKSSGPRPNKWTGSCIRGLTSSACIPT